MTKLAERAKQQAAPAPTSKLSTVATGALQFKDIEVLPGLHGRMRVIPAGTRTRVEAETRAFMASIGMELTLDTAEHFEMQRCIRTLAEAIRDPDDLGKPLGSPADWAEHLTDDQLVHLWREYATWREYSAPLDGPLTDEDFAGIEAALAKKDRAALRWFGSSRLASFMLSTADRRSTSSTPSSTSSPSSPV